MRKKEAVSNGCVPADGEPVLHDVFNVLNDRNENAKTKACWADFMSKDEPIVDRSLFDNIDYGIGYEEIKSLVSALVNGKYEKDVEDTLIFYLIGLLSLHIADCWFRVTLELVKTAVSKIEKYSFLNDFHSTGCCEELDFFEAYAKPLRKAIDEDGKDFSFYAYCGDGLDFISLSDFERFINVYKEKVPRLRFNMPEEELDKLDRVDTFVRGSRFFEYTDSYGTLFMCADYQEAYAEYYIWRQMYFAQKCDKFAVKNDFVGMEGYLAGCESVSPVMVYNLMSGEAKNHVRKYYILQTKQRIIESEHLPLTKEMFEFFSTRGGAGEDLPFSLEAMWGELERRKCDAEGERQVLQELFADNEDEDGYELFEDD